MTFFTNLSLIDIVYLAGFLDGDGSIIAQLVFKRDYKWGFQIRLTIQFTQATKRRVFLEKLLKLLGAGYIRDRVKGKSQVSDLIITEAKFVYALLQILRPYLRIKQKQADLVMRIIEQLPLAKDSQAKFIELAELVDQVSNLNDTKSRKHTSASVDEYLKSANSKNRNK